jgi:hypothetical protein
VNRNRPGQKAAEICFPEQAVGIADLRQHGCFEAEKGADSGIPLKRGQIEQLCARSVRKIGFKGLSARQVIDQPAVDCPTAQLAPGGGIAGSWDIFQYPGEFGCGEIGRQVQAGCRPNAVAVPLGCQAITDGFTTGALPDDAG